MPFYLGTPVPLTFLLTDEDGNPVEAVSTQPVLTITLPDQTTVTPPVTAGMPYTATGPSPQAGHYTVAWSCADATYPGGFTDAYDIRPLTETSLLSFAECKRALRIAVGDTSEDDFIAEFARSVTSVVEWWCGPVNVQPVTERLPAGGLVIQLSKPPVISLTAWTTIPPALATAGIAVPNPPSPMFPTRVFGVCYPLSQLYADPVLGVVTHTSGLPFYYGEYIWSYTAGRPVVPDCIQSGFKAILKHVYGMERGGQGSAALGAGESETTMTPMGYAVPNRALELMAAERPDAGGGDRMTTTSQVPAVIDYLVTACQQSASLGASTSARVIVTDGPPATTDTFADPLHLYIGGVPDADQVTATSAQAWPVMDSARTRDEDGDITLTADAWGGGTVMKTQRDACAAIVAAVELLLRGVPSKGGPGDATMGGLVMWSSVDGPFSWTPRQTQQGAGCSCEFRVTYRARLTTS